MNKIARIIKNQMNKSEGKEKVVKVPKEKRSNPESLKKLDREIKSQLDSNAAMEIRSWQKGEK